MRSFIGVDMKDGLNGRKERGELRMAGAMGCLREVAFEKWLVMYVRDEKV